MSVGAILILSSGQNGCSSPGGLDQENCHAGPIVCWDVLGRSVLQRTISNLQNQGISPITVIAGDELSYLVPTLPTQSLEVSLVHRPAKAGVAAVRSLAEYVSKGVDTALLMRLGAYVELDFENLLQFHRSRIQPATPIYDTYGRLDCWIVDAAQCAQAGVETDGSPIFERKFAAAPYFVRGYANRLQDARDFRRLIVDSLMSRCTITPDGIETKPGVWIGDGARIHRKARIVAPAYVGSKTKIEAGAVITRCSSIARGSRVQYGTVVEDSSILPDTYIGDCLDVSHAVVSGNHLVDLRRNVEVSIDDSELVDSVSGATDANFAAQPTPCRMAISSPW